ncbi:MAG TPA: T9SS type A sorting domain-containing protein [Bacteroidia bacterium]|nr:T9SS type A sorting domain-containing protein [Bacteroidia bacterium]
MRSEWQSDVGSWGNEYFADMQATSDGGSIAIGTTCNGASANVSIYYGNNDYWLVKYDSAGQLQWEKTYGGYWDDNATSIITTSDGGYLIGGYSSSPIGGNKTVASHQIFDYWVLKLNANGNIQWQFTCGTTDFDYLSSLLQTNDGGYLLAGTSVTLSSLQKPFAGYGDMDYWIIKLDSNGVKLWDKCYGGADEDLCTSIVKGKDGNVLLGGISKSYIGGNKTEHAKGLHDYWIVKINSTGDIIWQNTIGASQEDYLYSLYSTEDNGFVLGGNSNSSITNDKTENKIGLQDFWIIKVDSIGSIQWQNTIGGTQDEFIGNIIQNKLGGYTLVGISASPKGGDKKTINYLVDNWIVFLDSLGNIIEQKTVSTLGNEGDKINLNYYYKTYFINASCKIINTYDGNYILGTTSNSNISLSKAAKLIDPTGNKNFDFWLQKFSSNYNLATGKCFVDVNKNNVFDINEIPIQSMPVSKGTGTTVVYTDTNGNYELPYFQTGNYTYKAPKTYNSLTPTPTKYTVAFSSASSIDSVNNFAYKSTAPFNDLEVSLEPLGIKGAGDTTYYIISYKNNGTASQQPTLVFYTDYNFVFISSSITPDTITTDSLIWNLSTLPSLSKGHLFLKIYEKPNNNYLPSQTKVAIFPIANDVIDSNNVAIWGPLVNNTVSDFYTTQSKNQHFFVTTNDKFTTDFAYSYCHTKNDTCKQLMFEVIIPLGIDFSTFRVVSSTNPIEISYDKPSRFLKIIANNLLLYKSNTISDTNVFCLHFQLTSDSIIDTIVVSQNIFFVDSLFKFENKTKIIFSQYCDNLAKIIFDDSNVCETDTVKVNNIASIPFSNNFVWVLDSDTVSTNDFFIFYNLVPGNHNVTLIVNSPYCQKIVSHAFSVNSFSSSFKPPIFADLGQVRSWGNPDPRDPFQWYFNGTPVGTNYQSCQMAQAGWYQVFANNIYGCQSFSDSLFAINCFDAMDIQLSDLTPCPHTPLFVSNNGNFKVSAKWWLDLKPIPGDSGLNITSLEPGIHKILLKIDSANCKLYDENKSFWVNEFIIPYLVFVNDTILCDKTFSYYEWFFNGVSIPNNNVQNLHPDSSGYYQLFVIDSLGCSHFTDSIYYHNALGVIHLQLDKTICEGDAFFATNQGNYPYNNNFNWFVDSIFQVTDSALFLGNLPAGNHKITLMVIDYVDTVLLSKFINVNALPVKPVIAFANNVVSCNGSYNVYKWYRNDTLVTYNSSMTIFQAGWYKLRVENTSNCFIYSDSVFLLPCNLYLSLEVVNSGFCIGDTLKAYNKSIFPSTNYWTLDGNFISSDTSISISGISVGWHTLVLEVTANGCTTTTSASIIVSQPVIPLINKFYNDLHCNLSSFSYLWYLNGNPISNSNVQHWIIAASGWYKVSCTNLYSCTSFSDSIFCNLCPPMVNFNVYNDNVCFTDTIIAYSITPMYPSTYWSIDGVFYSSDSLIKIHNVGAGIHNLRLNSDSANCVTSHYRNITFAVDSARFVAQNNLLTSTYNLLSYQWYLNGLPIANATNKTLIIYQSGYYSLSGMANLNCFVFSDTLYIPLCNYTPTFTMSSTSVCMYDTVVCYMNQSPSTYKSWMLNGTFISQDSAINIFNFPPNTNFISLVYSTNFCYRLTTQNFQGVTAIKPTITVFTNQLQTNNVAFANFQWLLNGALIPLATTYIYTPNQSGYYQVDVTYPNGCSNISDSVYFGLNGFENYHTNHFSIYPSPADENIQIHLFTNAENTNAILLDKHGRIVLSKKLENKISTFETNEISQGVYTLIIEQNNAREFQRIVIVHNADNESK